MSKVNFDEMSVREAFDVAIKVKLSNPNTNAYDIQILANAYSILSKIPETKDIGVRCRINDENEIVYERVYSTGIPQM